MQLDDPVGHLRLSVWRCASRQDCRDAPRPLIILSWRRRCSGSCHRRSARVQGVDAVSPDARTEAGRAICITTDPNRMPSTGQHPALMAVTGWKKGGAGGSRRRREHAKSILSHRRRAQGSLPGPAGCVLIGLSWTAQRGRGSHQAVQTSSRALSESLSESLSTALSRRSGDPTAAPPVRVARALCVTDRNDSTPLTP